MSDETKVTQEYGGSQIQVLEGLEAVRKRPGMYIGSTSSSGLHHLVYEIVDNAIDEALAGYCKHITVTINPGDSITVTDDGRGIPVDIQPQTGRPALEVVYTVLHAGGKFGGGGYKVSGGLHGVGASVVNALSEWLRVRVHKNGEIYEMKFARGHITQEMKVVGKTDKTGTEVTFQPDPEMFDSLVYDYEILHERMREEAFLNAGLAITITDDRDDEKQISETMCYEGGIKEFAAWCNRNKTVLHDEVIYMKGSKGDASAEIAVQYNDGYNEFMLSFANDVRTPEGGMHETGFKTALTRVLNNYGMKNGIIKGDDKVSGDDCREGITAIISVKLTDAQFEGQTKAKLGNAYIRTLVDQVVNDQLTTFFEEHPQIAKAVLDKAMMANRAREAARKARESIRRKTGLESGQMPDKLQDCNERNPELCEIYIVEGDSAAGSAIQGRDSRFQAILAMWGKMLNVEKARADKIYGNDKLYPLIVALGAGIGDEFDLEKLRYHKVVIMSDADVDGAHIRTLLLTFFFRYMRQLIEDGHVYLAQPPLFKVYKGKNKNVVEKYAFDEDERDALIAEMGSGCKVQRYKGLGEMDPAELWETTMNPETRTLLLTFFFRYMRPLIEHGYVYSAVPPLYKLTRGRTTKVAYSDDQRDQISAQLRSDNANAKVDISRFKGLGEMDPHELWETTMDPEKRTLRRITLEDARRADEIFTVLMGEQVEPRKDWIERNAKYAVNLDF